VRGTEPTGAPPCYSTLEAISKHRREDDEVFRACLVKGSKAQKGVELEFFQISIESLT